eukprot:CAMPEP_0198146092 /NCGR_PEP_ID=MMETSP1443-20131203/27333_1 /TAXON_ID=186043 /ORGANISM="Entomoneis sp., Strain CCMP2396" /LENGTH=205 /DNA_ID=CAMNT_0043809927 /DNA_START=220 /DNA_END=837 /DNA_ORIENTATION=+
MVHPCTSWKLERQQQQHRHQQSLLAKSTPLSLQTSSATADAGAGAGADACFVSLRGGGESGGILQPKSMEELDKLIEECFDDKLLVVDFYSTNCPPCEKIAPLYQELSECDEFCDKVVFVKINVDEHPDIASRFGVTGWPTFLFMKKGEVQTEIVGGKLAEVTLYDWVRLLMPKQQQQQQEKQQESLSSSPSSEEERPNDECDKE